MRHDLNILRQDLEHQVRIDDFWPVTKPAEEIDPSHKLRGAATIILEDFEATLSAYRIP